MPVLDKSVLKDVRSKLSDRTHALLAAISGRELRDNKDGAAPKKYWVDPSRLEATIGSKADIALAVADLQAQIKSLK